MWSNVTIGFLIILTHEAELARVKCNVTLNVTKKKRDAKLCDIHNRTGEIVRLRNRIHVYTMHEGAMSSIDRRCILRPLSDAAPSVFLSDTQHPAPLTTFAGQGRSRQGNSAGWSTIPCEIGGRFNKHRVVPLVILSRISCGMHRAEVQGSLVAREEIEKLASAPRT